MRRGNLFFIGLLSAIITIVSLNYALGRPGYFHDRYPFYHRHRCYDRYDDRYDDRYRNDQHQQQKDSTNSNY